MVKRISLLGVVFLVAAYATTLRAAELFDIPSGMMVRSVLDWENVSALEVKVAGKTLPVDRHGDVEEHLFSRLDLCEDAAYRVIPNGQELADNVGWISLNDYCLSERDKTMSFVFIADSQQHQDEHKKTGELVAQIKAQHPDVRFILNGGDLVHFGLASEWKKYRAVSQAEYSSVLPLVPAVGNHEFYGDFRLKNWHLLYDTEETSNHYYALDFPLFAMVVLDSNVELMLPRAKRAQTAWLEAQLQKYEGVKPVIVAYHHAAYTSGKTQYTMPLCPIYIRRHWQPLFEKYGVKAVLNGHEHIYERLNVNGIQYILAGPAGGVLSKPGKTSPYSQFLMPGFRSVSHITVDASGKVHLVTWSVETNSVVDEYDF